MTTTVPEQTRLAGAVVAVVRIGVALLWIQNSRWKTPPDFGEGSDSGLYMVTRFAVDRPVFGPFQWLVEHVVLPNFTFFGWVTLLVEASLGAFLLVGLATRLWALIGAAQSVVITLSALYAPNEWHWGYYLMILAHLGLFAMAAGRRFGVDGVLRAPRSSGRAGLVLGLAALACLVFTLGGPEEVSFIRVEDGALIALVVLGALAVLGGLARRGVVVVVAGAGFLIASVVQLVQLGRETNWFGGDGSTASLFLGLGVGMLAVGFAGTRSRGTHARA